MNASGRPSASSSLPYDALLLVSFGGPEEPADVVPFLENVTRGRNVPRNRLLEVAQHYQQFGGRSPLNEINRRLVAAVGAELRQAGLSLPVYWGNRNWHPLLTDTVRQMAADGVQRALAFVTSAFGSYSGCRQYLEDIQRARDEVGPAAPAIDKLRLFYNHPGFIEAMADRVRSAAARLPAGQRAALVYTAHSIPVAMAERSPYESQLREACRLVSEHVGWPEWTLAYQSRSGPPGQPWLEPDIGDHLSAAAQGGASHVVVVPIGFLAEHVEVLYDLDVVARDVCRRCGLEMIRAEPVGVHPRFVTMIRELVAERIDAPAERLALGSLGPAPDVCPADCCRPGQRRSVER
jgi:protoporphyrin/coproporphyrin ferrochelatase